MIRHLLPLACLCLLVAALAAMPPAGSQEPPGAAEAAEAADELLPVELRLSSRLADLQIEDGSVIVQTPDGPRAIPAEDFLRAVESRQRRGESRGWLFQLFDITGWLGMVWIAIGFGGQFLFTGRMIVQWLASEKHKRSIVPPAFWWMSLTGASMLLAYFVWRRDVVGIFGQATGWFIYARNLWLIYKPHVPPPGGAAPVAPI